MESHPPRHFNFLLNFAFLRQALTALERTDPPASASQMPGQRVCTTTPRLSKVYVFACLSVCLPHARPVRAEARSWYQISQYWVLEVKPQFICQEQPACMHPQLLSHLSSPTTTTNGNDLTMSARKSLNFSFIFIYKTNIRKYHRAECQYIT